MVSVRREIDVTELAAPGRLARELGEHPEGLLIREGGKVIATIMPEREGELDRMRAAIPVFGVDSSPLPDRRMTSEQVEQLLVAVHELAPFIDADLMHYIVDKGRQLRPDEHGEAHQAVDSTRISTSATPTG